MINSFCNQNYLTNRKGAFSMIKWIISDMDGTLLVDHNKLPEDFDEVMQLLKKKNIMFSPASGRQYQALAVHFPKYKDDLLFISENGTYVCQHDKELFSYTLSPDNVALVLEQVLKLPDVFVVVSGKKSSYVMSQHPAFVAELNLYFTHYTIVEDFSHIDDDIIKFSICDALNHHARENIYNKLQSLNEKVQVVLSSEIWVDIMPIGANKGLAIKKLQEKLNIKPEECVAFGDYLNDYEMLQSVYYSYAMENAAPELKKIARFIAPPNYENGVMNTIRKLLSEQK